MVKRLFILLLVLASLSAIVWTLWDSQQNTETEASSLLDSVPMDAELIVHSEDARSLIARLTQGNILWTELSMVEGSEYVAPLTIMADSLISHGQTVSMTYSLHPVGAQGLGFLLQIDREAFSSMTSFDLGPWSLGGQERDYESITIHELNGPRPLYLTQRSSVLQISNEPMILETCIRHQGGGLYDQPGFMTAAETASAKALARVFIDHQSDARWNRTLLPQHLDIKGYWSCSELDMDAKSMSLHGLISIRDSSQLVDLNLPEESSSYLNDILSAIPSDAAGFHKEMNRDESKWIRVDLSCAQAPCEKHYILRRIEEGEELREGLSGAASSVELYRGVDIFESGESPKHWTCLLGNVMMDTEKKSTLREALDDILAGRHLANDARFEEMESEMSMSPFVHHYWDIGYGLGQWKEGPLNPAIMEHLKGFHGLLIQTEPANADFYHLNVHLRHQPAEQKEARSLLDIEAEYPFEYGPQLVQNHYTEEWEIAAQDSTDQLQLYDTQGRRLWSRNLDGPILSPINQVDALKNGKLQMLFHTAQQVYLLDRKGRDVEGWPQMLSDSASSSLSVMDYDGNNNYRILVPTRGAGLINLDISGKEVQGWKYSNESDYEAIYRGGTDPIIRPPSHHVIGSKDYILCLYKSGRIRFIARDGSLRFEPEERLELANAQQVFFIPGRSIEESSIRYLDSSGEYRQLKFGQGEETLQDAEQASLLLDESALYQIKDGRIIYFSSSKAEAEVIEASHKVSALHALGRGYVLAYNPSLHSSILLFDGAVVKGSPFSGLAPAAIDDMNKDGSLDLSLRSSDGRIVVYSLAE